MRYQDGLEGTKERASEDRLRAFIVVSAACINRPGQQWEKLGAVEGTMNILEVPAKYLLNGGNTLSVVAFPRNEKKAGKGRKPHQIGPPPLRTSRIEGIVTIY